MATKIKDSWKLRVTYTNTPFVCYEDLFPTNPKQRFILYNTKTKSVSAKAINPIKLETILEKLLKSLDNEK